MRFENILKMNREEFENKLADVLLVVWVILAIPLVMMCWKPFLVLVGWTMFSYYCVSYCYNKWFKC